MEGAFSEQIDALQGELVRLRVYVEAAIDFPEEEIDFLEEGKTYTAKLYRDAEDSHWDENPQAYAIEEMELKKGDKREIWLAPGGGFAISLMEKQ